MNMLYHIQKYQCTLLEPAVLKNYSGSEITVDVLDFINGNKFLGIVASQLYKTTKESSSKEVLDLFHNGKVQYGNAYLSLNDKQSYPVPGLLYEHKTEKIKGGSSLKGIPEKTNDRQKQKEQEKYKQSKTGYLLPHDNNKTFVRIEAQRGERLKSAYDTNNRSAKAENMFLYQYLEKGQSFVFEIRDFTPKGIYLDRIEKALKGIHYIATSKGEFGRIEIKALGNCNKFNQTIQLSKEETQWVYAESDLAFIDRYGKFTWQPKVEDLGFQHAKINYEKSRLWFDHYTIRNGTRKNIDEERMIIKKGSVFAIETKEEGIKIDEKKITRGLGVFLSEGYGRILINPSFLKKDITFNDDPSKDNTLSEEDTNPPTYKDTKGGEQEALATILKARLHKETKRNKLLQCCPCFCGKVSRYDFQYHQFKVSGVWYAVEFTKYSIAMAMSIYLRNCLEKKV